MSWKRAQERKHRLINLYNKTKTKCLSGVWYDEENDRYHKYSINNGRPYSYVRYCKNSSNRRFRRKKLFCPTKGSMFKKHFDLKWELY